MLIERLDIREGMYVKTFTFDAGMTLICSNGKNSVGKTTLVRLLLFALGENVPMTQGFRSAKISTRLIVETDSGRRLIVTREDDSLTICSGEEPVRLIPSLQGREIKRQIFGVTNNELADNLLGACYIDQDKGWTLLNRGKVIGSIHFSIEGFFRGLSGDDYSKQLARLRHLAKDIEKYSFFVQAAGYQDTLVDSPSARELSPDKSRDRERLNQLRIQSASLRKRIASIRRAQNSNERFVKYITDMKLQVKLDDGRAIDITSDNLLYYKDNDKYMNGEVLALSVEKAEIDRKAQDLEFKLCEDDGMFENNEGGIAELDKQIAGMKLDVSSYENILHALKEERKDIQSRMKQRFTVGNPLFDRLTSIVNSLCDKLGVGDYFRSDCRGVLTSTLQHKSGTNYHLLVFAYRLAYATLIDEKCGLKLPLVIDSIRGREMSEENFSKCIALLEEDFADHQIIIASISGSGIAADKVISLQENVMENASMVPDLAMWE